jgi:PTS system cellobiose-specific IIB component
MRKIFLICNAGMSTGILAKRIQEASNGEYLVKAYGLADYLDYIDEAELILVGPQIRYLMPDIQKSTSAPVVGINPMKYGTMDGKGVCQDIKKLLGDE